MIISGLGFCDDDGVYIWAWTWTCFGFEFFTVDIRGGSGGRNDSDDNITTTKAFLFFVVFVLGFVAYDFEACWCPSAFTAYKYKCTRTRTRPCTCTCALATWCLSAPPKYLCGAY